MQLLLVPNVILLIFAVTNYCIFKLIKDITVWRLKHVFISIVCINTSLIFIDTLRVLIDEMVRLFILAFLYNVT